jgi:hypothetical protein
METDDLTPGMQEMLAKMAAMRAELDNLKNRANAVIKLEAVQPEKSVVPTNRRTALRRLAGGILAGLAVSSVTVAMPDLAQARFVASGGAGAIVMPPGGTTGGSLSATGSYGLIASSSTNLNLAGIGAGYKIGVYGSSSATGTNVYGVYGQGGDTGVYGQGTSTGVAGAGATYGVSGFSTNGYALYGHSINSNGLRAESDNNNAIFAYSANGSAIWGSSPNGSAGYFTGNVQIVGSLSKSSGTFKIDHPLDPANKYLYHSFVESPDMMNIYNGIVTLDNQGEATVEMPDWFEALNTDFRYQLTSIGAASPNLNIARKIQDRRFKIAGGQPGQEVSWQVTGIRQDAYAKTYRSPVEQDKREEEKGKYIHPELFGQPEEMAVHYRQVAAK